MAFAIWVNQPCWPRSGCFDVHSNATDTNPEPRSILTPIRISRLAIARRLGAARYTESQQILEVDHDIGVAFSVRCICSKARR